MKWLLRQVVRLQLETINERFCKPVMATVGNGHNPFGVDEFCGQRPQGSSFLATLGWRTQSLRDWWPETSLLLQGMITKRFPGRALELQSETPYVVCYKNVRWNRLARSFGSQGFDGARPSEDIPPAFVFSVRDSLRRLLRQIGVCYKL